MSKRNEVAETRNRRWLADRVAWHKAALAFALEQVDRQLAAARDEHSKQAAHRIVMKRLGKLEVYLNVYHATGKWSPPRSHAAPFHHEDAAALVLWTRGRALKLAHMLGLAGSGPNGRADAEDLSIFNMDWFNFDLADDRRLR